MADPRLSKTQIDELLQIQRHGLVGADRRNEDKTIVALVKRCLIEKSEESKKEDDRRQASLIAVENAERNANDPKSEITRLFFTGTVRRDLIEILITAGKIAGKTVDSDPSVVADPIVVIGGRDYSPGDVAKLLSDEFSEPLLPHHQAKIDAVFKKRQHGYGRTASNLASRCHDSVLNAVRGPRRRRAVWSINAQPAFTSHYITTQAGNDALRKHLDRKLGMKEPETQEPP